MGRWWLVAWLLLLPAVVLAVEGNGTQCGVVNTSITLQQDLVSSGTCYTVNASDIVINGGGFSITGDSSGNGINITNQDNVTITNFGDINNFSIGVYMEGVNTIVISASNITNNITSTADGIFVRNASGITVQNSNITVQDIGIHLRWYGSTRVNDVVIDQNRIITYWDNGIEFDYADTSYARVTNNSIDAGGEGIIASQTNDTNITGNTITSWNSGIYLEYLTYRFKIEDNTILARGGGNRGGIVGDTTYYNRISRNNVTCIGQWGIQCIGQTNANYNLISGNRVNLYPTSSTLGSYGIYLGSGNPSYNNITSNNVFVNNTNSRGLLLDPGVEYSWVENNNFTTEDGGSALWIRSTARNNTLLNNNFTAIVGSAIVDQTNAGYFNFIIYNNSYGEIRWTNISGFLEDMDATGSLGLGVNLFIGSGVASVDAETIGGNINDSVDIRLYSLPNPSVTVVYSLAEYITDQIVVNTDGTDCVGTTCTIVSYSGGILTFNTTGLGSFSPPYTGGSGSQCGVVDRSITLTQDIVANGTCYTVNASNIVIDGAGYSITGNNTGYGILVSNFDNVTITNFGDINNFSNGVRATGVSEINISQNTITNNRSGTNYGVYIANASDIDVENNSVVIYNRALYLTTSGSAGVTRVRIDENMLYAYNWNAITFDYTETANSSITNNHILYAGNVGINVAYFVDSNITGNTMDYVDWAGIYGEYENYRNLIENNTIVSYGGGNGGGIQLDTSDYNIVRDNTITCYGTQGIFVIYISGGNYNLIDRNTIYLYPRPTGFVFQVSPALYAGSGARYNNYTNNIVWGNGSISYGIYLDNTNTRLNYFGHNNITMDGAYGMYISTTPYNNTFHNNNFTVSEDHYSILDASNANLANFLVYNNSHGEIRWTNLSGFLSNMDINGSLGLGRNIFIGSGIAAIDLDSFGTPLGINSGADITFYELSENVSSIYRTDEYYTTTTNVNTHGSDCVGATCTLLGYLSGTLRFNTTSLGSFSIPVDLPTATTTTTTSSSSGGRGTAIFSIKGQPYTYRYFDTTVQSIHVKPAPTSTIPYVTMKEVDSVPRPIDALGYFELEARENSDFTAVITFRVAKSVVNEKSNIVLRRLTEQWDALPTRFVRENSEHYVYEADTPGFSYFAITLDVPDSIVETPPEVEQPVEVETPTETQETSQPNEEKSPVQFEEPSKLKFAFFIAGLLLLLGVIGVYFVKVLKEH